MNSAPARHLLLITYYWPPCGGVAVQRWLQHVRHLSKMGWKITVYTAKDADYPSRDEALLDLVPENVTVIRQPIWEPYGAYRKLTGRKKGEQMQSAFNEAEKAPSLAQNAAVFVRSNFFIPDARRFWIKPSARFLTQWLKNNPVDVIATNGTPHSCHLIGLRLKRAFPDLPWLADFRDPWTNIDYFSQLKLLPRALARHQQMEKAVMSTADKVTTVSWTWREDFRAISGRDNVGVVTNGYNEAQFTGTVLPNEQFTIYHTGVMGKDRNYPAFWRALQSIKKANADFARDLQLVLIGEVDGENLRAIRKHDLEDNLTRHDFLPQAEVIQKIRGGALLLLLINQSADAPGRLPSKLYEYLGAQRPVLAISPLRGDAARILEETQAGKLFLGEEKDEIHDYLLQQYQAWKADTTVLTTTDTGAYSRRQTTARMARYLNEIIG